MISPFEALGRKTAMLELLAKKNSPKALFVGGVVGMVGSTVLACRGTLRLEEVLHGVQGDVAAANGVRDMHPDQYSEEDKRKDLAIIYVRSGAKIARLYAPAIVVGAVSIAALSKSHSLLEERNIALTAAYVAIDKAFREYRERVVDRYGEEDDQRFRYGTEVVASGDGKGKPKTIERVGPNAATGYARFFDEYSEYWSKEAEYNSLFLRCQQNYANDLLKARGHLFLNEVYQMLGIPHSQAGAVVGWIMGGDGDNYIDFGVFVAGAEDRVRDFVNGRERSILLDFNVDGVIFDKIERNKEAPSWQLER